MSTIIGTFTWDPNAEGPFPDREDDQTRRADRVPVSLQMLQRAEGSEAIPLVPNIARTTFGLSKLRGAR